MNKILVTCEFEDKNIDLDFIKIKSDEFLKEHNYKNNTVDIKISDHKFVVELAQKYIGETLEEADDHPVLSFPTNELEGEFVFHPNEKNYLGEIVVSYQKAIEYSKLSERDLTNEILDLVTHSILHLIGIHHN